MHRLGCFRRACCGLLRLVAALKLEGLTPSICPAKSPTKVWNFAGHFCRRYCCTVVLHGSTECAPAHWLTNGARTTHTAPDTECATVQHSATLCNTLQHSATFCNTLQHSATRCNTLQHSATLCNTLQHSATLCNSLQKNVRRYTA